MADYDQVKHLELISKAVERMGKASAALRTLSPAAIAIAMVLIERKVPAWLALSLAVIAVCTYWYQDAQYFGRERCFRKLYDDVRMGKLAEDPYDMEVGRRYGKQPVRDCMRNSAVRGIHLVSLMFIVVAFVAVSLFPRS